MRSRDADTTRVWYKNSGCQIKRMLHFFPPFLKRRSKTAKNLRNNNWCKTARLAAPLGIGQDLVSQPGAHICQLLIAACIASGKKRPKMAKFHKFPAFPTPQGIFLVPAPGGRAYIPRGVAIYTWYMPGIYPSVWVEHIPAIYTEVCP